MRDLDTDPAVPPMVLAVGDVARRLRLDCVAAGVATPQQVEFLRKNGWDKAQGPVFGEPLNGLNFAARWLTRSGRPQRVPLPGDPPNSRP